ncbi:MAG: cupin-like domain-containing protein [Pirellula sp.]|nr:cupin-like domain-containing protein [Pirellula sp.]
MQIELSNSLNISDQGISIRDQIDGKSFLKEHILANRPLLLRQMMHDWQATKGWSFEFFRSLQSSSPVHLEQGNVMQGHTGFRKASFADFIEQLIAEPEQSDGQRIANKPYLSVFKIFDEFPQLSKDVDFTLLNQFKVKHSTVGWLGPAGTVTGYHIDWGDNILAQVQGRKCIHLVSPDESDKMYVSKKFDQGTAISKVDLENYDGEMLFIPRGWWHHVRSLDKSISVSNLAFDLRGIVFDVLPQRVKQILHNVGLWPCECTCHVLRDGKRVKK